MRNDLRLSLAFRFRSGSGHRVIAITPPPNNTGKRARKWLPLRAVLWPLPFLFFLFDSNVLVYYTVRWILLFGVPMAFVLNWPRRS